jgi:dihydroxy-acid dehydratase
VTVSGKSLGANLEASAPAFAQDVVRPFGNPIFRDGGIAVLRGNLAPNGAIIKQAAATAQLLQHTGRAVVFANLEDLAERIDRDDLDVTADDVLVLQNAGPKGAPGMPESGYTPIPRKLARQGVKDMVRISDARMSGTAFGTIVLHVSPEAAIGGPLALVRSGDRIRLDTAGRRIDVLVDDAELEARRRLWQAPEPRSGDTRGYRKLFLESVEQAEHGCDFGFLKPELTQRTPRR